MTYQELQTKLKAVEARTGLYLSDESVDLENAGRNADDSTLYRFAVDAAAFRAEDAGFNINELLGENVW